MVHHVSTATPAWRRSMATAHQLTPQIAPHFDRTWLEACIAELDQRKTAAASAHHWTTPMGGALSYLSQFQYLAEDCLCELDGCEPGHANPQAELADMVDDACLSILGAIDRRVSDALVVRLAAGQRAYVRSAL